MGFRDTLKKWDAEKAKSGDLPSVDELYPQSVAEKPAEPAQTRTVPPKDRAALQRKIDAGLIPEKSKAQLALEALRESNTAAGQALMDQTFFGLPGKAARALGVYGEPVDPVDGGRGKYRRREDWIPNEQQIAGVPSAAIDMASMGGMLGKAGEALGQVPQTVIRKLGASEAQTAVRPALQTLENAAASGSLYGGISGAARNENLSELPEDIGSGMIEGAAGNALMSSVPIGFSALKSAGEKAITGRAMRPLVEIGQGVKADKALKGLGKGDAELGEQEMKRVIEENGLAPIINTGGKPAKMQKKFDAKLDAVWEKELGPIRAKALALEPDAKVPVKKIEERLRALVGKDEAGTDVHDDVEKAISLLKDRAEKIGSKTGFPVNNLLNNAREFERDGFGKSQPKFADGATARAIGRTLRELTDERFASIYAKNPNVVREMIGMPPREYQPPIALTPEATSVQQVEYRGSHKAPGEHYGAPLHDLTKVYPDDVYQTLRFYRSGDRKLDLPVEAMVQQFKGKPDDLVTIYRAVPRGVTKINPGDWVTINKAYAAQHAASEWSPPGQKTGSGLHVISAKVPAKEIYTSGDSLQEWGYIGADPIETKTGNVGAGADALRRQIKGYKEDRETNLEILGDLYQAARKKYGDLKKIEPLIDQLAMRRANRRPGFLSTLKHAAGNATAGALGFGVAGQHGIIPAIALAEGTRLGMPLAERATAAVGRFGAGNPVDPNLAGAIIAEKGESK